jgi:hypothetical protein
LDAGTPGFTTVTFAVWALAIFCAGTVAVPCEFEASTVIDPAP